MGSFSWATAEAMARAGFWPDTISSDVHSLCLQGPAWDLLRTMTKFLALGMPMAEVVKAATLAPARALRRDDLGTLAPGAIAEASVIRLAPIPTVLEDVEGITRDHPARLVPVGRVLSGRWRPGPT
jgi:dihydroorotase